MLYLLSLLHCEFLVSRLLASHTAHAMLEHRYM
jgi:hypothetical protein